MDDNQIIELFFARDEGAIEAVQREYGGYCVSIARNILGDRGAAEECVNDGWLKCWQSIPPQRPRSLKSFAGRIVRNLALSALRADTAQKRGGGQAALALDELSEVVSGGETPEGALDRAAFQAALDGLGLDGSRRLVIVLMQLVNLLQDGKPVRMSKRTGKAIALHDLLDEISVDAARYYFNNRASTSSLDFDLDLAVRQDSDNPVYYVQYAHARICSLLANLAEDGATVLPCAQIDPALLATEQERCLVKTLAQYPEEIRLAARDYDPSRINRYLTALAGDFHRFYNACRLKGEETNLQAVRLKLADSVRLVLANGLNLLGVSAPVKM